MKLQLFSSRSLPRRRLLVGAIAFIATGIILTIPASAMESSAQATSRQPLIVGIGDSYTAGSGNQPYTADSMETGCNRSNAAYPQVAAAQLQMRVRNYACSGATTAAFTSSFKSEPAQTSRLAGATAVVFTIGGNDVGALNAVASGDLSAVPAALQALPAKLASAYAAIKTTAPNAEVFAVTYPDVFPADDSTYLACRPSSLQNIALSDLHAAIAGLNTAITSTAKASGINVIDTSTSFSGHDICSTNPWVFGMNAPAPLHPNVAGQQALAEVVMTDVKAVIGDTSSSTSSSTSTTVGTSDGSWSNGQGGGKKEKRYGEKNNKKEQKTNNCDHASSTTSSTSSSTTSSSTSSTTSPTVVPATVVTVTPTSSSTTSSSTSSSTTSSTEAPTSSSSSSSSSTTTQLAQVESTTVNRNQLAHTGAQVTKSIAIAMLLLGTGLGLVWLRNYVRTRSSGR